MSTGATRNSGVERFDPGDRKTRIEGAHLLSQSSRGGGERHIADDDRHRARWDRIDAQRLIDERLKLVIRGSDGYGARHTDDRQPREGHIPGLRLNQLNPLADRILVWEEPLHETLIDDGALAASVAV